ncbi:MAG: DUF3368 domain-containing protein, partial [Okeania sp. SIO3B3]|nr:DUF3368 domain-containing protein [Okeania sp. SIO3B3]
NWLKLLQQIFDSTIIVPQAVAVEIEAYGEQDITFQALTSTDWLVITETPPIPSIIQNWDLGLGESEVLTWGYTNPDTEVIIDDLAARRCATALGIPVRGTLGLVLTAKQRGIIPLARPIVQQLRQSGMYLSDRVINQALILVGE